MKMQRQPSGSRKCIARNEEGREAVIGRRRRRRGGEEDKIRQGGKYSKEKAGEVDWNI